MSYHNPIPVGCPLEAQIIIQPIFSWYFCHQTWGSRCVSEGFSGFFLSSDNSSVDLCCLRAAVMHQLQATRRPVETPHIVARCSGQHKYKKMSHFKKPHRASPRAPGQAHLLLGHVEYSLVSFKPLNRFEIPKLRRPPSTHPAEEPHDSLRLSDKLIEVEAASRQRSPVRTCAARLFHVSPVQPFSRSSSGAHRVV